MNTAESITKNAKMTALKTAVREEFEFQLFSLYVRIVIKKGTKKYTSNNYSFYIEQ